MVTAARDCSAHVRLTSQALAFLRFVTTGRDRDSGADAGAFSVAYDLLATADLSETDRAVLREHLDWFQTHLFIPPRFNRTSSKGYYRRNTRGIAWFRDTGDGVPQADARPRKGLRGVRPSGLAPP
jgi:hypothetical protein